MYLPGYPYHIVQRGHNRDACFVERENYQYYLEPWKENATRYGVAAHAYRLMINHIHFLVTPDMQIQYRAQQLSSVVGTLGTLIKSYKWSGTVWEGRRKSSLVQTDRYYPTCCRYMEMNPVVAGIIRKPEEYRCSS
jgi:putative transposase